MLLGSEGTKLQLRKVLAGASGATLAGISLTSVLPASANGDECTSADPNSTKIAESVCEIRLTADGTWTPPAEATALEALLVGAGYGGDRDTAYAGGGGSVEFVTSLQRDSAMDITIGQGTDGDDYGGLYEFPNPVPALGSAADTSVAQLGNTIYARGAVGGYNLGFPSSPSKDYDSNGHGAGGLATATEVGPGKKVSDFTGYSTTLWPDADDLCFGEGGSGNLASNSSAVCGGGNHTVFEPMSIVNSILPLSSGTGMDADANTGSGGGASRVASGDGADGIVIFRFAVPVETITGGGFSAPSPFQGPVITDVGADNTVSPFPTSIGNNVRVLGENLSGVSSVLVNGIETELVSVSENSFVFTVPEGLESGTYDLTVVSGGQNVQVQEPLVIGEGLSVEEAAAICDGQAPTVWTQRISLTQAKAYIKCGTPGVSYRVSVQQNGSGPYDTVITRTLSDIYDERQLFNTVGRYVVRTIDLTERTRIRIYSDEEKLWQVVYNKDSYSG